MRPFSLLSLLVMFLLSLFMAKAADPINVIVFGAHPDDPDVLAGGIAAIYAQTGHKVKFVSLTNGCKGHQTMKPDELAARRKKEAQASAKILGIEYVVMDNADGELMPTLENRFAVIKLICDWNADIVITHRPNDYHPDHRNTGVIVQDAAYMVSVPQMVPDGVALRKTPLFLYLPDRFQKPHPFSPDIVVDITAISGKKAEAICAHESQMYEWLPWNGGWADKLPSDPVERCKFIGNRYLTNYSSIDRFREGASKWYSSEQLKDIRYVEAFEICEYGSRPNQEGIKRLFPMLP